MSDNIQLAGCLGGDDTSFEGVTCASLVILSVVGRVVLLAALSCKRGVLVDHEGGGVLLCGLFGGGWSWLGRLRSVDDRL